MFDIAFSELIVIAIIALLVIGPEQLPKVARTVGHWFGKLRQYVRVVQADVEREFRAEELKRIMNEQARSSGLYDLVEQTKATGEELKGVKTEIESLQPLAAPEAIEDVGVAPDTTPAAPALDATATLPAATPEQNKPHHG